MSQNNELPPLKNIETSGTYKLKLVKPKDEKIPERFKENKKKLASCRLFFVAADGHCMTKNYSVEYGKGLAMLVGKLTGDYLTELPKTATVDELYNFCAPAFGKKGVFEIEVEANGEWNGRPQFNYSIKKISPLVDAVEEKAKDNEEDGVPF